MGVYSIRYFVLFAICLTFCLKLQSQDVHFSQRLPGDRQRNAAFLDDFEGNIQALTIYRQQWQSIGVPFTTAGLMATKKFSSSIKPLHFFGGISFINDQSGDAKLNANQFSLHLGAAFEYGFHKFRIAVTNAIISKNFNQNGLSFPSQFDRNTGRFNENLSSGENFSGNNLSFYDLGFGLLSEHRLTKKWKVQSGFSMQHVNEGTESFFEQENSKNIGYGIQLVGTYAHSKKISLEPYISFYRTKGASETIMGSAIILQSFFLGPFEKISPFLYLRTGVDRLTDAVIVGSRADFKRFQLGISYDFNVSELELASNYRGSFEALLIYTLPNEKLTQKRINCERY